MAKHTQAVQQRSLDIRLDRKLDPSAAFLRLFARIFTDVLPAPDTDPRLATECAQRDQHVIGTERAS